LATLTPLSLPSLGVSSLDLGRLRQRRRPFFLCKPSRPQQFRVSYARLEGGQAIARSGLAMIDWRLSKLAPFRHAAASDLSPHSGVKRKSHLRAIRSPFGPRVDVGCLAASSVWTAVRAIANCGRSCYPALTVQAEAAPYEREYSRKKGRFLNRKIGCPTSSSNRRPSRKCCAPLPTRRTTCSPSSTPSSTVPHVFVEQR
jgi:hypothetical protein